MTYLTDDEGAITKTYEYDAFGNEENPVSTDTNAVDIADVEKAWTYYATQTANDAKKFTGVTAASSVPNFLKDLCNAIWGDE